VYGNPAQALSFYRVGFYDLILLDYRMPIMDGFTFYTKVKSIDPNVKFCLMTAYDIFPTMVANKIQTESRDSIFPELCGGKPTLLKKPFDKAKVLSTLAEILNV
jgi:CheY-like chemotaxis protein